MHDRLQRQSRVLQSVYTAPSRGMQALARRHNVAVQARPPTDAATPGTIQLSPCAQLTSPASQQLLVVHWPARIHLPRHRLKMVELAKSSGLYMLPECAVLTHTCHKHCSASAWSNAWRNRGAAASLLAASLLATALMASCCMSKLSRNMLRPSSGGNSTLFAES